VIPLVNYFAKIGNNYINILGVTTSKPNRLRDCHKDRDAIIYTEKEIRILRQLYPQIQTEIFKLYKRESYAPRNNRENK
jgi:hypothetical protein